MKLWIPGKGGLLGAVMAKKADFATGRELDIADFDAVCNFVKTNQITHIVNCAAYSAVDAAEREKEAAFRSNVTGPKVLAQVAKEVGAHLIHLSTDYVFDGTIRRPLTETDPTGPLNYYAQTKLAGEKEVLAAFPEACVLRTSWIFGNGGKNFVAKMLQMLHKSSEIRLTDDQWGRPTYALDLADAIPHLFNKSGIYHYANKGETTKYLFGCAMRDKIKTPIECQKIIPVPASTFPSPCKRPVYSAFDTSKMEQLVKIRPWQEALEEFLCNTF